MFVRAFTRCHRLGYLTTEIYFLKFWRLEDQGDHRDDFFSETLLLGVLMASFLLFLCIVFLLCVSVS